MAVSAKSAPKIGGLKKRQAIDKASQTMLLWVIAAAVTVSILVVGAQFFYSQFTYNNKVIGAKNQAAATLEQNLINIEELKKNFAPLEKGVNPNVDPGKILSALPPELDTSDFGTSLQQVFALEAGVTLVSAQIDSSGGSDEGSLTGEFTGSSSPTESVPQNLGATIVVSGNYEQIAGFMESLERSIRPITIDTMNLSGTSGSLRATIELTTYYQPEKTFTITKEELPR